MPFFTVKPHGLMKPLPMPLDQVEVICNQHSTEHLQNLKQRMRAFFTEQSAKRKKAHADISAIDEQINSIEREISENQEQIKRATERNQEILSNLPGNGAERYLALQKLYNVPNISSMKEDEIKNLQVVKAKLRNEIAWINYEFTTCDPEWQIVNKILDGRVPKEEVVPPTPDKSMKF